MSVSNINGTNLGNSLQQLLMCDDLLPGDEPSYQVAKTIYEFHPLGAKMAEAPITMAQSQKREILVASAPDKVREAFEAEFESIGATSSIHMTMTTARIYGIATLGVLAEGVPSDRPLTPKQMVGLKIAFNIWDPLNTAGSLVLNQNPNALDFQKHDEVAVSGVRYHRSRTVTVQNERPIYIGYTNSAFGFVGRSVYQRALYPLRSYVKLMIADDMIATKAGVIVAKMKAPGSIIDNAMAAMFGLKRNLVKEAKTNNVLGITPEESIESLNLQNLDGPLAMARKDVLENVAIAADMPAKLLNQETFASGFGEGTEDAKSVARYIDRIREEMNPLYNFMDEIVQYRAWNPEFYKTIQHEFPEQYANKSYTQAFYEWKNAFKAKWPSLLTEPESERIKVEETIFKAVIAASEVLIPTIDPSNKVRVLAWVQDSFNERKMLFKEQLDLDFDELENFLHEQAEQIQSIGLDGGAEDISSVEPIKFPKPKRSIGL